MDRGKTSLMILIDQLDLLGSTMDKVFDAVNRADAAALIAHGRFLQEKFGTGSTGGGLALGPTASTPATGHRTRRDHCNHHLDEEEHERRGGQVLQEALSDLLAVAARAGVPEETARAEALSLAAALAESAPAHLPTGPRSTPGATTQDFFDAAVRGRRWRGAPTAVLTELVAQGSPEKVAYAEALAEVASAACTLGEPTMRVIGNASVAAAAQLQAAGARPAPGRYRRQLHRRQPAQAKS